MEGPLGDAGSFTQDMDFSTQGFAPTRPSLLERWLELPDLLWR
jgi:hypothetical protein